MRRVFRNLSAALLALLVCATGAGVRAQKRTEAGAHDERRRMRRQRGHKPCDGRVMSRRERWK